MKQKISHLALVVVVLVGGFVASIGQAKSLVVDKVNWESFLSRHDLIWNRLPNNWSEAAFLGNGRLAVFVHKEPGTNAVRFGLDRTDVFDRRDPSWGWTAFGRARYHVGDFQLHPEGKITGVEMRQDLYNAELRGTLKTDRGEIQFRAFVHATSPVIVVELKPSEGERHCRWRWRPYEAITTRSDLPRDAAGALKYEKTYGNPVKVWVPNPPHELREKSGTKLCIQKLLVGGGYTTAWREVQSSPAHRTLYCSIAMSHPKLTSPVEAAAAVGRAADLDIGKLVASHRRWWHEYYPASFVSLPDTKVESFYWIQMYKYASAARADSGVMDTHGPWFQPTGWPYTTFDMNTQISYWGLPPANRLAIAESLFRNLDEQMDNLIKNVRPVEFQKDSAWLGVTAQQEMICPVGDDPRYDRMWSCLPWICHNYWLQYRYSMDDTRLRRNLFPLLRRSINFYLHYVEQGADEKLHLPETFSPEYYAPDGRKLTRDCTMDLALLKWGCQTLLQICDRLNVRDPLIPRWQAVVANLVDFPTNNNGFMVGRDLPLENPHRHLGHLFPIHPLYQVTWEQPANRELIEKSLAYGAAPGLKGDFLNFTMAWASCMYASMGRGQTAHQLFMDCHRSLWPNTMFAFSGQNLETPLVAVAPIHDMLLQSWGDKIRVFFAAPADWPDITFRDLRTEGAFLVSAVRKGGRTQWIRIKSLAGEPCRVWSDFAGPIRVRGDLNLVATPESGVLELKLRKGDEVVLFRDGDAPDFIVDALPPQTARTNLYGLR